jgi:hypothetical protein
MSPEGSQSRAGATIHCEGRIMRAVVPDDYGLYLRLRLRRPPLRGARTASVDSVSLHEWLHDFADDGAVERFGGILTAV